MARIRKHTGVLTAWLTNNGDPAALKSSDPVQVVGGLHYLKPEQDMCRAGWVRVGVATVTIELIDDDSIIKNKIDGMKAEIRSVQAEAQHKIDDLNDKINQLLAITHDPESEK